MTGRTPVSRRTALGLLGAGAVTVGVGVLGTGAAQPRVFVATLDAREGVETNACGIASFRLRDGSLEFALHVANLVDPFMTHIHEDEVVGSIAVWLQDFETQAEAFDFQGDDGPGRVTGVIDEGTITDDVIKEGRAKNAESRDLDGLVAKLDAGEAFVNVHTVENPNGELVGQIGPSER